MQRGQLFQFDAARTAIKEGIKLLSAEHKKNPGIDSGPSNQTAEISINRGDFNKGILATGGMLTLAYPGCTNNEGPVAALANEAQKRVDAKFINPEKVQEIADQANPPFPLVLDQFAAELTYDKDGKKILSPTSKAKIKSLMAKSLGVPEDALEEKEPKGFLIDPNYRFSLHYAPHRELPGADEARFPDEVFIFQLYPNGDSDTWARDISKGNCHYEEKSQYNLPNGRKFFQHTATKYGPYDPVKERLSKQSQWELTWLTGMEGSPLDQKIARKIRENYHSRDILPNDKFVTITDWNSNPLYASETIGYDEHQNPCPQEHEFNSSSGFNRGDARTWLEALQRFELSRELSDHKQRRKYSLF